MTLSITFNNNEIKLYLDLNNDWKSTPPTEDNWKRSYRLSNLASIAAYHSERGLIEVISTDSPEMFSDTLRDKPNYHRALMRARNFKSLLKDLGFRKMRFYTTSETMPETDDVIERPSRRGRNPEMARSAPGKYIPYHIGFSGFDATFGNILAIYSPKPKNEGWILLCTIGCKNIYVRFTGNNVSFVEEELKEILNSIKWEVSNHEYLSDIWIF